MFEFNHSPSGVSRVGRARRGILAALVIGSSLAAFGQSGCPGIDLGYGGNLHGFVPFPVSDLWNQPIANDALDPQSSAIINFVGPSTPMNTGFAGSNQGQPLGLPYYVVSGTQPKVNINVVLYPKQSDPGPMPIPPDAPIQTASDHHVLVIDRDNCFLYELF